MERIRSRFDLLSRVQSRERPCAASCRTSIWTHTYPRKQAQQAQKTPQIRPIPPCVYVGADRIFHALGAYPSKRLCWIPNGILEGSDSEDEGTMNYQEALDNWERTERFRNVLRAVQGLSLTIFLYLIGSFFPPNQGSISGEHQQYNYAKSLMAKHHKVLVGKAMVGCLAVAAVSEVVYERVAAPEPWEE